jgi:hypothetical protein
VSGMGGYTSKCEKKAKSLHPTAEATENSLYMRKKKTKFISSKVILYREHIFGCPG